MVQLVDMIMDFEPYIVRETMSSVPDVQNGRVVYNNHALPPNLSSKFLTRCYAKKLPDADAHAAVAEAMEYKTFVLHGRKAPGTPEWYALTSDAFKPIMPRQVLKTLEKVTDEKPTMRQYTSACTVDFNVPVSGELPGMHVTISLGEYGLYGGNGESALKYGVSWHDRVTDNWMLFLSQETQLDERVIHRSTEPFGIADLAVRFFEMREFSDTVTDKINASKKTEMPFGLLNDYLMLYAHKRGLNKSIAKQVLRYVPEDASVYDVATNMTRFSKTLTRTDRARKKVECLSGELVIAYDRIVGAVRKAQAKERQKQRDTVIDDAVARADLTRY